MDKISRVELTFHTPYFEDVEGRRVLQEIKDLGIKTVKDVSSVKVFKFKGLKNSNELSRIKKLLLLEPLWLKEINSKETKNNIYLEVSLKPGVTNTEIDSIIKAVSDLGIKVEGGRSGRKYFFFGNPTHSELDLITNKILINKTIEKIIQNDKETFHIVNNQSSTEIINITSLKDADLVAISKERMLFLTISEMKTIQKYFKKLKREPTDCELETLAQTWSEHNYHKTFKSRLVINGKKKSPLIERIKNSTKKLNHPDALVTFSDNAGIVSFDKNYAICGKTETHNSPSAIEPYGGAMTGSGGVFRDIAGTGLGAQNIASTDIFCFANPELPISQLPKGCIHPKRIMQKCVAGVRHYGNCMGIPTINGSMHFHKDYRAKPVVLVGAYGIMPKKYILKKKITKGDIIISVGGKTGRDGIHGATFSSGEMSQDTESLAAQAVQIGNPIEEIRMFDALLEARDEGFLNYITDCGGGGYSSAIGEMGERMGVKIDLSKVPLKYSGIANWEIWLSESQERMVVVLSPKNWLKFKKICLKHNTGAWIIGKITGTRKLEVVHKNQNVVFLDMEFLHHGLPLKVIEGKYRKNSKGKIKKLKNKNSPNYTYTLKKILSDLNVASKEEIVRRYDHEVQGKLVLKPFIGVDIDGPSDAAIIKPLFNSQKGMAFSHGLSPDISLVDAYWGSIYAVDEAVRNLVAVGCSMEKIFLLDNFIFPKPDPYVIGDLDKAVDGLIDIVKVYKTPFVSGKDSLSGSYANENLKINVPPTVCVSAFGAIEDIELTISSDFKNADNLILLLGEKSEDLKGSVYSRYNSTRETIPQFDIKKAFNLYQKIYQAVQKRLILSLHDISEGGMLVAVSEMCFGGGFGAKINLKKSNPSSLFSEPGGSLVAEVKKSDYQLFKILFQNLSFEIIGEVTKDKRLHILANNRSMINENIESLKTAWKKPFLKYF